MRLSRRGLLRLLPFAPIAASIMRSGAIIKDLYRYNGEYWMLIANIPGRKYSETYISGLNPKQCFAALKSIIP